MSQFSSPAEPSSGIPWNEVSGCLLLIDVKSVETGISTSFGEKDAVRADVAVLDGPQGGTEYPDCLVFPLVLKSQLTPRIGTKVLGRVGQGNAKPGQKPPWMLTEASPQDQQLAERWLAHKQQPQQPAPTQQQPSAPQQPQQPQTPQQVAQQTWPQQSGPTDVPF